ncbi:MAG: D-2-hydroxyacid dehydrogenase family protein [Betaproteobacteria bacterium]|nr:D-2-hydroxyacid dehydrogenase family protein [Betaproteobacteria bacterium]
MKIAVLDDYQDAFRKLACFARLKDHEVVVFHDTEKDPARLAARLKDADAVILSQQRSPFPRAVIEKLPGLKLIAQTGSHREHIDIAACSEKGIVVAAVRYGASHSTVELTWGLILASLRHIPHEVQQLKRGMWQTTVGTGLRGKTLGVYGLGKIGGHVAHVGKAFGMKVICWGREASQARAREAGYTVPASREAFFENADIISLHIRYNAETRGIVTRADLARMKTAALIVNTSRAPLIEEGALLEALAKGRPGFAAIDVYEDEPVVGGNHPLLKLPNVICTPHLGGIVQDTYEHWYSTAIESILAFASGKPVNAVNPEALGGRAGAKNLDRPISGRTAPSEGAFARSRDDETTRKEP